MKTNRDDTKNIEAKRLNRSVTSWNTGTNSQKDFRDASGEPLKPLKIF